MVSVKWRKGVKGFSAHVFSTFPTIGSLMGFSLYTRRLWRGNQKYVRISHPPTTVAPHLRIPPFDFHKLYDAIEND